MKILSFEDFLFEEEKVYQGTGQGDPYSYKVVDGIWFTKGPKISDWKSLEGNQKAIDKLDQNFPEARKGNTSAPVKSDAKNTTTKTPVPLSIGGFGKFTPSSNKSAPLVVVFGGIPVGGRQSGDYMYDYFNKTGNKYNLFVANTHKVDGVGAYNSLKNKVAEEKITPAKKILYLFSGGYAPGMSLLNKVSAGEFDKIYLVDIWMGNQSVSDFYKKLTAANKNKVEYYYTQGGSANPQAAKAIADSASKKIEGSKGHMATNIDAVNSLTQYA
jgi:hypothetical protein